ncbi:inositol monophosphatase family protein [Micromonospora sp. NPDC048898]|uniref:inositol monophosphatase family protein n=1 Tax=Micromonospora sp. NPDC048898 TaxID=3364260 RepID=UPI003719818A
MTQGIWPELAEGATILTDAQGREIGMDDSVRVLRDLAREVAHLGGVELLRHFGDHGRVDYKSSRTDPVSAADRASEQVIVALLRRRRPSDGILAEEGSDQDSGSGLRWVIDPLDGTVNYISGIPFWCVSVACERATPDGWAPLLGVVHDPVHDETFHAVSGAGAWLGERQLRLEGRTGLDEVILATGYAYDVAHRKSQADMIADLAIDVRGVRMLGSTALALAWVAAGRIDAYVEDRASPWDWAAGRVIAAEAGASVEPLDTGVFAAPPELVGQLRSRVRTAG